MDGSGFCWTSFGMNPSPDQKLTIMLLKEHETFILDGNSLFELMLESTTLDILSMQAYSYGLYNVPWGTRLLFWLKMAWMSWCAIDGVILPAL
ncbi:hypothetical protein L6452_29661 [Arctium lappa]|uniref:Uncharacterized protein n=1 Tax=Arctium lappa TaxID=4217 RepID=A0ACB8ZLG7_ARCLA|nr:hypothetical protein L6452_29661 [Arctium lappa]